jgi:hypothetical protein
MQEKLKQFVQDNANIVEYTAMDEQGRLAWVRKFLGVV